MLTHLKKLKLVVRVHAILNIFLVFILVIYLCQVVISEYLDLDHDLHSENQPRTCWILWLTVSLIAVIIIPLQITADAFLCKDMNDTLRSIQKYQQWLRISTLFIAHCLLGVILAFFCPISPSGTPVGGFILIALILASRLGSMYSGYNYKRALESIVYQTTTPANVDQGGFSDAHAQTALASPPQANGGCRSISPDFLLREQT